MKRFIAILAITTLSLPLAGVPAWSQESTEQQAQADDSQQQSAARQPQNIKEWVSANRARKSTVIGAIGGAILGGLLARARGQNVARGAAAGAVVGGVAGYLVGSHRDKVFYSRDQAIQMAGYQPSDGYVMRIQEVRFDPETIKPGQSATLHIRYLVIGPDPNETIKINCYRGIKYQGSYMTGEQASFEVPNGGGVVESTAEFSLPAEAPAGTYAAEATVEEAQGRVNGSKTSPLYIAS
ncbi:MAG TPA: glycine zipper domain-containing protein [Thermoanaerobaculia bacterium]|nr:glycine zipper domain-containing protein [Thermoanaerobaculia bacterium]